MIEETITESRNRAIIEVYYDCLKSMHKTKNYVKTDDVVREVMGRTAPRFFISYPYAQRVVSLMRRGLRPPEKNPNRRKMYEEIYNRFMAASKDYEGRPIHECLQHVIDQPAPSFYLNFATLRTVIYKTMKK